VDSACRDLCNTLQMLLNSLALTGMHPSHLRMGTSEKLGSCLDDSLARFLLCSYAYCDDRSTRRAHPEGCVAGSASIRPLRAEEP
jgi:hypothetical protein